MILLRREELIRLDELLAKDQRQLLAQQVIESQRHRVSGRPEDLPVEHSSRTSSGIQRQLSLRLSRYKPNCLTTF